MINLSRGHSVQALKPLIAHRWKVHVGSLLSNFDSLKLCIVEIIGVVDVFGLRWIKIFLKVAEVSLVVFALHFS